MTSSQVVVGMPGPQNFSSFTDICPQPAYDVVVRPASPTEAAGGLASFSGLWSKGSINGGMITWADGNVDKLQSVGPYMVEVSSQQPACRGELKVDDKIYWSDGEVWTRESEPANGAIKKPLSA